MNKRIKISGQQFCAINIDDVIEGCSKKNGCALIIEEHHVTNLLAKNKGVIGVLVSQIIIISEDLNSTWPLFKEEDLLLVSAVNFEEAIRIAVSGVELNKEVIYVSEKGEAELKELLKLINIES